MDIGSVVQIKGTNVKGVITAKTKVGNGDFNYFTVRSHIYKKEQLELISEGNILLAAKG